MLTRIQVDGFKNLDALDVRFGPFTCIAGPNGVGKSNLFDAIAFLAALADKPLVEAALSVRGGDARRGDVRDLFRRLGDQTSDRMRFEVEMIIPQHGEDALGQPATASMTFLQYQLELRYRPDATIKSMGTLELVHESMVHINRTTAHKELGFRHKKAWRDSVVTGRRTSPYISTEDAADGPIVSLHADSKSEKGGGRPRKLQASSLPRTMLSSVNNAAEHRTLVLARQEMMSWTQLQLEPSALRAPDAFTAPRSIGPNGAHLPATLFELAQAAEREEEGGKENVYARVANQLSQLVEDVRRIHVDVDDKRQLLSIVMTDRHGTEHVAGALSDGTLRFLALTIMQADPGSRRLVCLEEPENGMHPLRIPAVIDLLGELAVDPNFAVDDDNALRQVIVNTHSPTVVACVKDDELLMAEANQVVVAGIEESRLSIRHLPDTWRHEIDQAAPTVTRGVLQTYLNPAAAVESEPPSAQPGTQVKGKPRKRVMERTDLQLRLPLATKESAE